MKSLKESILNEAAGKKYIFHFRYFDEDEWREASESAGHPEEKLDFSYIDSSQDQTVYARNDDDAMKQAEKILNKDKRWCGINIEDEDGNDLPTILTLYDDDEELDYAFDYHLVSDDYDKKEMLKTVKDIQSGRLSIDDVPLFDEGNHDYDEFTNDQDAIKYITKELKNEYKYNSNCVAVSIFKGMRGVDMDYVTTIFEPKWLNTLK